MNEVPYLGEIGYVPPRKSFTTIVMVVLALVAGGYAIYHFFLKPLKSNESKLAKKEVDSLKVMVNRLR